MGELWGAVEYCGGCVGAVEGCVGTVGAVLVLGDCVGTVGLCWCCGRYCRRLYQHFKYVPSNVHRF